MKRRLIRKILVANRGEIAVRIMRTCKELGIATVAVYSDADRLMPHVLMSDEAYPIGPAPSRESYLSTERILNAANQSGADAIHPGYGFLSENATFAEAVTNAGIKFIGPSPDAIKAMGDKTHARAMMSQAGVPVVPGTSTPVVSLDAAYAFCEDQGFPVLIKAAAGGGGKGMRVVNSRDEFSSALRSAQSEAGSAFGDDRVYLEKYLQKPRHIEFQILGDEYGNIIHLGERECSIQRRHQKVVEETPSVIMDDVLRSEMGRTALRAAEACGYFNAGTVEFLVDESRNFYFLEMNTRLQVEHPVTEMRTGIDLVAEQIRIASGEPLVLKQPDVQFSGHAVECRVYAEDVRNNFLPSTGTILHLKPSEGFGVREDRGVEKGGEVSIYYDPMIAKLVAWGRSRNEALDRMRRALREYEILGVETTIPLSLFVIDHPLFRSGDFDTHFLENHWRPDSSLSALEPHEQMAAATLAAVLVEGSTERVITSVSPKDLVQPTDGFSGSHQAKKWKQQRSNVLRNR